MNQCPKCGKQFEGNFCPECGYSFSRHANKQQSHPLMMLICSVTVLIVVLTLSIAIPFFIGGRYDGTYYRYRNGTYNYAEYFIIKGDHYTDEDGYTGDVKFDGNKIELYAELFGVKGVMASGTIEENVLKLNIMGTEATYMKAETH